jgi:hemolysin activation/secretion protein
MAEEVTSLPALSTATTIPTPNPDRLSKPSGDKFGQRITPPPPEPPLPDRPLPPLPDPAQTLPPGAPTPPPAVQPPGGVADVFVERFEVVGSTVFSEAELAAVLAPFTNRELTFAELLEARAAIAQLYVDAGYISSGAVLEPQAVQDGVVQIQVIEGSLEGIEVNGTRRLNPGYISSRLALAGAAPLNLNQLLQGLQLLNLDPLIKNISAELQTGDRPETRLLVVEISEAKSFFVTPALDNSRVPSVGTFRQQIEFTQGNLTGAGDN